MLIFVMISTCGKAHDIKLKFEYARGREAYVCFEMMENDVMVEEHAWHGNIGSSRFY